MTPTIRCAVRRAIVGCLLATLPSRVVAQTASAPPTVTYLANMGVMLTGATTRVVIDGFHHGALAEYAPLRAEDRSALEMATGPYAQVDAILITHRHADHFQAAAVAARLAVDARVRVIAPPEVVDSLLSFTPTLRGDRRIIVAVPGVSIRVGSASVTPLDLPHNPTPTRRAQNVGFLVVIDSLRVLHVGDADPDAARFRAAVGPAGRADVAVVPFWYLTSRQPSLLQAIGAARLFAAHVPMSDTVSVKRQLAPMSAVTVLASRGLAIALRRRELR